jgi:arylsulfatase A-like enzyme
MSGNGISRRQLLGTAAAATPALFVPGYARAAGRAAGGRGPLDGMNVVMFITDQERAIQHFPPGWARQNLPGLTRLQRNGVTFERAFTNSCMCSPARSTLLTGYFPAQHGVKYTLEENMSPPRHPQVELPENLDNIATVASAAGYEPVYKGKWHVDKPAGSVWRPSDVGKYGFNRWDPPDAGANQDLDQAGGGRTDNDGRYMNANGNAAAGREGALQYLNTRALRRQPFFLVVSLVNPHDVLFYPNVMSKAGYSDAWTRGSIGLPATVNEDLSTKPTVQQQFLRLSNLGLGSLTTPQMKRDYLNFYGNLMRRQDAYLRRVLDTLRSRGLLDDTLVIRTSDHGEMGLAHGGLRQKNFNMYEEALRVPLVFSNPRLFPRARRSDALVSHVDFLPTVAGLLGAPRSARAPWQGRDYSRVVLNPDSRPVQDYVVFTYDDFQSGQASPPYPEPPNHIVAIREERWKLARYYDVAGRVPDQWEMYDLLADPYERQNLTRPGYRRTPVQEREYLRLRRRLAAVERTRLRPLRGTRAAA